jgi:hypothetical protein
VRVTHVGSGFGAGTVILSYSEGVIRVARGVNLSRPGGVRIATNCKIGP